MQAILPYNTLNRETFLASADSLGFDKTTAYKFIYIMQDSDMDVFPLMGEERINILLYAWQLCERYRVNEENRDWEPLRTMLNTLVPLTLNTWFSEEWKFCRPLFQNALLHCLERAKEMLSLYYLSIDWDHWLDLGTTPYNIEYLKNLKLVIPNLYDRTECIENVLDTVNIDDVEYVMQENYYLIALRLIKLFDCRSLSVVQTLSMRVIAGWNELYLQNTATQHTDATMNMNDKNCLIFICHMYLLATYEMDDVTGFALDNMVNNIRFYYDNFASKPLIINNSVNAEYTPARLIAITCIRLRLYRNEFFENFIWDSYDTYVVTLFGVVSQAYKVYLLGNLLMDLKFDDLMKDFASSFDYYKRLMTHYIRERENSELFLLNEIEKKNAQSSAYNISQTIKFITDFESKICKGNRISNIRNCEGVDYENVDHQNKINIFGKDDNDNVKKIDPVFENLPNSETVLNYVYEGLISRSYKGWRLAKVVTLIKSIGLELSSIEKWRYHPGLTPEFMLNLEVKLSKHYEEFAKIFEEYWFFEQEFCLTAFYLNPNQKLYDYVIRCGVRFTKRRLDENLKQQVPNEKTFTAKFGLLSSSIDVKEIVSLTCSDALHLDYEPLCSALHSLHLPDNIIKDILTVVFLPRNKSFSWVVNWNELRKRCKALLRNVNEKRRFVELNMAEANDRLKFLKIDYEKYKNRPQLDYGTIEEGYESHINATEYKYCADNYEEMDYDDLEDEEDNYTLQKEISWCAQNSMEEECFNCSDDDDEVNTFAKRRTRSCTAALANAGYVDGFDAVVVECDNQMRNNRLSGKEEAMTLTQMPKQEFKDYISQGPTLVNSTPGFKAFPDIWNASINDLKLNNHSPIHLVENSSIIKQFINLHKSQEKKVNEEKDCAQETEDINSDKNETNLAEINTNNEIKIRLANLLNKIINTVCNDELAFKTTFRTSEAISQNGNGNTDSSKVDYTNPNQLNEAHGNKVVATSLEIENANNVDSSEKEPKQTTSITNVSTNFVQEEEHRTEPLPNNDCGLEAHNSKLDDKLKENEIQDENFTQTEHSLEQKRLEEFKTACTSNNLKVRLHRLSVNDVRNLRQPVVILQPLHRYSYPNLKQKRSKRLDYAESSDDSYEVCKDRHYRESSESSIDSVLGASRRSKYAKRRKLSNKAEKCTNSSAERRSHLIVTPRSKNGLKLRITNTDPAIGSAANGTLPLPLSSASASASEFMTNDLSDSEDCIPPSADPSADNS